MINKKFKKYTKHGLGITESGKLLIPYKRSGEYSKEKNGYGQPLTKIGEKIVMVSSNGMITKNNFGELIDIKFIDESFNIQCGIGKQFPDPFTVVKFFNGKIKEDEWLKTGYTLSEDEYNDILDFYNLNDLKEDTNLELS